MADIRITHRHRLTPEQARQAAQQVADQMAQEYGMRSTWNGDVLEFGGSGVSGMLTLADRQVDLEVGLGFLFKSFAPAIEQKLAAKMQKVFGAA